MIFESGKHLSELGQMFEDAETATNIGERIRTAKEKFLTIANREEEAFQHLAENVPRLA